MRWKRAALATAIVGTWFGAASAQDASAPLLLPPASGTDASAGAEAGRVQAGEPAGPDLVPPAPAAQEDMPSESAASREPALGPIAPAAGGSRDAAPNAGLRPGERLLPAEQVIRQRRPAGAGPAARESNFRPVAPPVAASGAEYEVDDAVRQATANLAIDDETRSRYRLNGDEWWFQARSGKWMYFRNGAWQEFDPRTYRRPGAVVTAGGTAALGGSATVSPAGGTPGPYAAGQYYGPGPYPGAYQDGPVPNPAIQPYPGYLLPPGMDEGDLRRAERRARRGGGLFGWLRD